jgi:hypothetical protein
MKRYNIFDTFLECKEAQHYDHLFQRSYNLAMASNVDVAIIRELNLHDFDENGEFYLDKYLLDNGIEYDVEIYERVKQIWKKTTAWSLKFKYNESFVYLKDHSDRTYPYITIENYGNLIPLDEDGNEIIYANG